MAIDTIDARIVNKRSTVASEVPTVPTSSDHTDGSWTKLDIYSGEIFLNETDNTGFIRIGGTINQFIFGVGGGVPPLDMVLGVGNTTGGTDLIMTDGDDFVFDNDANRIYRNTVNDNIEFEVDGGAFNFNGNIIIPTAYEILNGGFSNSISTAALTGSNKTQTLQNKSGTLAHLADLVGGIDDVLALNQNQTADRTWLVNSNNLTLEGIVEMTLSGDTLNLQLAVEQKVVLQSASTSLTCDLSTSNHFEIDVDATGAFDYSNAPASNRRATYIFKFIQDATGYAVTFTSSKFRWASGSVPTIDAGANEVTILSGYWDGSRMVLSSMNDVIDN